MREAILITGTGKSGTTLVAKACYDAGAPMGALEELSTFAGGGGNVKGVWEHQEAMDLNKAILRHNGIEWYDEPAGPLALNDALEVKLRDFIAARPARFVMKDPRFVWTAPLWARHIERVSLVACFRSPLGFAKSATRVMPEIFPATDPTFAKAMGTWRAANGQLLALAQRFPTTFFNFDESPEDMQLALSNLLEHHGLGFDAGAFRAFFVRSERRFSDRATLSESLQASATDHATHELWQRLQAAAFSPLHAHEEPGVGREVVRLRRKQEARKAREATQREAAERDNATLAQARNDAHTMVRQARAKVGFRRATTDRPQSRAVPPSTRDYDLVVPCYNAPELTKICVESLIASTDPRHRIWLLDDRSPDPAVGPLLQGFAEAHPHVRHLKAETNKGFPGTVNWGIALSDRDVIIVNNDTEFAPGWIDRMDRALVRNPKLAALSPLSNNATICSVPQQNTKNTLPEGVSVSDMAALVAEASDELYPRVPTVVGFCMLMTRAALDAIGDFDEWFGLGYGEEVDWCQRAWMAGFECALCDDAYVYHHGEAGQASVGRVKERQKANEEEVARRWPAYHDAVYQTCMQDPLRALRLRLFERLSPTAHAKGGDDRPHVMQVVHAWQSKGGTELHTRDLADACSERFRVSVLNPELAWAYCDLGLEREMGVERLLMNRSLLGTQQLVRGAPTELRSARVERLFADALEAMRPDIVHFQHLVGFGSFLLPSIARAFGARVVMTLHDYFLLCPEWNLIGPDERDCGNVDSAGCGQGDQCLQGKSRTADGFAPATWPAYLAERKRWARAALDAAHVIVTPSQSVRQRFGASFGDDIAGRIVVLPHGTRAFETVAAAEVPGRGPDAKPSPKRPVRVAFLGNFDTAKGAETFMAAAERLQDVPVALEVVGASGLDREPPAHIEFSGGYDRQDLPERLRDVDAVVVPSIWHETYCYTVDEAHRLGLPVIASEAGAIQERVVDGETGLLFPMGDSDALANAIRRFATDDDLRRCLAAGVAALTLRDHDANMALYLRLYGRLVESERTERPDDLVMALMARAKQRHAKSSAA